MPRPQGPPPFRRLPVPSLIGGRDLPVEKGRSPDDYEFQVLAVPRGTSIRSVRTALAAESEYGRWDLVRTRHYYGGEKRVWMRRRIIRVSSTLPVPVR
ncbi:DUF5703 family protein [Brachybacterium sp. NPDC056505]|uniref:DUF5703 family protein n=1 Tax=Brachybacterium sp. NPDC056505 TaxID=3345843 RepID=UPI00366B7FF1